MFHKQLITGLAVLAMLFSLSSAALADCQKKLALSPSAAGVQIDASGTAEVRARGTADQRFKVSIDARVPDGTTIAVFANGQLAGTITIALGAGELDLNNHNGKVLPAGTDPACSVTSVEVKDGGGTVILSGNF